MLKFYSLSKLRRSLRHQARQYRRKVGNTFALQKEDFQRLLTGLQVGNYRKRRRNGQRLARSLGEEPSSYAEKLMGPFARSFYGARLCPVVASLIRQMWFELYTIPSGSMRPTLKENDFCSYPRRISASILSRGHRISILIRLSSDRGSVVIFSVENLDVPDPDTKYFLFSRAKNSTSSASSENRAIRSISTAGRSTGSMPKGMISPSSGEPLEPPARAHPFHPLRRQGRDAALSSQGIFSPVVFLSSGEPVAKLVLRKTEKFPAK